MVRQHSLINQKAPKATNAKKVMQRNCDAIILFCLIVKVYE